MPGLKDFGDVEVNMIADASGSPPESGLEWPPAGATDGGSVTGEPATHLAIGVRRAVVESAIGTGADIEEEVAIAAGAIDEITDAGGGGLVINAAVPEPGISGHGDAAFPRLSHVEGAESLFRCAKFTADTIAQATVYNDPGLVFLDEVEGFKGVLSADLTTIPPERPSMGP